MVMDREAWLAAVWGHKESDMTEWLNNIIVLCNKMENLLYYLHIGVQIFQTAILFSV